MSKEVVLTDFPQERIELKSTEDGRRFYSLSIPNLGNIGVDYDDIQDEESEFIDVKIGYVGYTKNVYMQSSHEKYEVKCERIKEIWEKYKAERIIRYQTAQENARLIQQRAYATSARGNGGQRGLFAPGMNPREKRHWFLALIDVGVSYWAFVEMGIPNLLGNNTTFHIIVEILMVVLILFMASGSYIMLIGCLVAPILMALHMYWQAIVVIVLALFIDRKIYDGIF